MHTRAHTCTVINRSNPNTHMHTHTYTFVVRIYYSPGESIAVRGAFIGLICCTITRATHFPPPALLRCVCVSTVAIYANFVCPAIAQRSISMIMHLYSHIILIAIATTVENPYIDCFCCVCCSFRFVWIRNFPFDSLLDGFYSHSGVLCGGIWHTGRNIPIHMYESVRCFLLFSTRIHANALNTL